jgi:anthranilate/para-aminobenzoate synthase component I
VNPSPFMFYLRMPGTTLVGSSPEIMVRVVDGIATVRPLAGTRRAAPMKKKMPDWPPTCSPTRRNAPSM